MRTRRLWTEAFLNGAPGGIRTPNPQIRSLMLCPVELRAHGVWPGSKIDDFEAFFKKESIERRRNIAIGDEHAAALQQKSPRCDLHVIFSIGHREAMFLEF